MLGDSALFGVSLADSETVSRTVEAISGRSVFEVSLLYIFFFENEIFFFCSGCAQWQFTTFLCFVPGRQLLPVLVLSRERFVSVDFSISMVIFSDQSRRGIYGEQNYFPLHQLFIIFFSASIIHHLLLCILLFFDLSSSFYPLPSIMRILCVAEKNDVAKTVSRILSKGQATRRESRSKIQQNLRITRAISRHRQLRYRLHFCFWPFDEIRLSIAIFRLGTNANATIIPRSP